MPTEHGRIAGVAKYSNFLRHGPRAQRSAILSPHGRAPERIHAPGAGTSLGTEVDGLSIAYAATGFQVVKDGEGAEAARGETPALLAGAGWGGACNFQDWARY